MNRKPGTLYHRFWRAFQREQMNARHQRRANRRKLKRSAIDSERLLQRLLADVRANPATHR